MAITSVGKSHFANIKIGVPWVEVLFQWIIYWKSTSTQGTKRKFVHLALTISTAVITWRVTKCLTQVIPKTRQVPPQLFHLGASLRTLDLSSNKIKVLPSAVGGFTSLKSLTLKSNHLGKHLMEIIFFKFTTHLPLVFKRFSVPWF